MSQVDAHVLRDIWALYVLRRVLMDFMVKVVCRSVNATMLWVAISPQENVSAHQVGLDQPAQTFAPKAHTDKIVTRVVAACMKVYVTQ